MMNTNENLNYQTSRKVVTNVDTNLLSKNNNYKDSILQKTFSITYALLLTTAVITIVLKHFEHPTQK